MSLYINTFLGGTLTFKGRRLDSINQHAWGHKLGKRNSQ
jgi:hypothetical protein